MDICWIFDLIMLQLNWNQNQLEKEYPNVGIISNELKMNEKKLKLSQRELAEGICKQGQISRLESGEFTPGADFYMHFKKLKVSMDYFLMSGCWGGLMS